MRPIRLAALSTAVALTACRAPNSRASTTVAANSAAAWPAHVFAPYVDMTGWPTPDLGAMSAASGGKFFTLAVLTADTSSPATATWGGYDSDPVASSSATEAAWDFGHNLIAGVNAVRAAGGDVMASFGGANGTPIDSTITDPAKLVAEYQRVITTYQLRAIDLDVEGSWVADAASIARRSVAMATLEANNPGLKVWYTLPVNPTGLTTAGLNVLKSALSDGVRLGGVNVMAMDYGDAAAPNPAGQMGAYAIDAATATHAQLKTLLASYGQTPTDAQLWAMQGVTPMIGVNDTTDEVFTAADARQLLAFAQQKNLGYLSFWSATRDHAATGAGTGGYVSPSNSGIAQADYAFSKLYAGYGRLLGDANLDGVVDGRDYAAIDAGYLQHLTGWANGDFNGDGVVDGSDYTLIDNAFNTLAAQAAATAEVAAVPEPAAAAIFVAVAGVGRRRRASEDRRMTPLNSRRRTAAAALVTFALASAAAAPEFVVDGSPTRPPAVVPLTTIGAGESGYFSDPVPVHLAHGGDAQLISGTTKAVLTGTRPPTPGSFAWTPLTVDAGTLAPAIAAAGATVTNFQNVALFQDDAGGWHAVVAIGVHSPAQPDHWTVLVHAHPTAAAKPAEPPLAWSADAVLSGSFADRVDGNYDGRYYAEDGKLYLLYVRNFAAKPALRNGIVLQPMESPARPTRDAPTTLLLPGEGDEALSSEWYAHTKAKLVEAPALARIGGKYALVYSAGAYREADYKSGVAWSDTLMPAAGGRYRKVLVRDPDDLWSNPGGRDVRYLLQSQRPRWANFTGKEVVSPGVASPVAGPGDAWWLYFAGFDPDDRPLLSPGVVKPNHRRPYAVRLRVAVPAGRTVATATDAELADWLRPERQ